MLLIFDNVLSIHKFRYQLIKLINMIKYITFIFHLQQVQVHFNHQQVGQLVDANLHFNKPRNFFDKFL